MVLFLFIITFLVHGGDKNQRSRYFQLDPVPKYSWESLEYGVPNVKLRWAHLDISLYPREFYQNKFRQIQGNFFIQLYHSKHKKDQNFLELFQVARERERAHVHKKGSCSYSWKQPDHRDHLVNPSSSSTLMKKGSCSFLLHDHDLSCLYESYLITSNSWEL